MDYFFCNVNETMSFLLTKINQFLVHNIPHTDCHGQSASGSQWILKISGGGDMSDIQISFVVWN